MRMDMALGDKKKIIVVLAAVWAVIIAYNVYNFGFSGGRGGASAPAVSAGGVRRAATAPHIRHELPGRTPKKYPGVARDIFSPVRAEVKKPVVKVSPPSPPPPPPAAPTPLEDFVSGVRFMGFLEKGAARTVFINRGSDVFMVKAGDLLYGRFRVSAISDAELTFVDEPDGGSAVVKLQKR